MKYRSSILNFIQLIFSSVVRVHLAIAVLLLFGNAGVPWTIVTAKDKTIRIAKTVEALHVDFSSKVIVPVAPHKAALGFYLLPHRPASVFVYTLLYTVFTQFLGTVATNTFYVFTCINAP